MRMVTYDYLLLRSALLGDTELTFPGLAAIKTSAAPCIGGMPTNAILTHLTAQATVYVRSKRICRAVQCTEG